VDWSRFGLDRPPFRPAVDTAAYFPAQSHETALAVIAAAFARREPAVLIDGVSGVGKSLVVRKWLDDLLPDVPRVFVPNAHAERPGDLLQAILFDLGKPYQGLSEQELRLSVTGHLLDSAVGGFPTVLVIDEAQHLSLGALEELRLLGNLETRQGAVALPCWSRNQCFVLRLRARLTPCAPTASPCGVRLIRFLSKSPRRFCGIRLVQQTAIRRRCSTPKR
jgi:type II secretory pathway predicted ATPase ExeA